MTPDCEVASIAERFNESCSAYDAAKRALKREDVSSYEQGLRKAMRESVGAVEQALKVYIGNLDADIAPSDQESFKHIETFVDLLRMFRKYAKPKLSRELWNWCMKGRGLRNLSEHEPATVPPREEVARAIRHARKIISDYFHELEPNALARCSADTDFEPADSDSELSEKTYYRYRDLRIPLISSIDLVTHLAERYQCECLVFGGTPIPIETA
ncbi:MAG TPA: hypothetical protein VMU07_00615 [Candidatus Paceibacterota bacterium]|nr:hypothetical protein [Candidatus Paceibacterota bacterium]